MSASDLVDAALSVGLNPARLLRVDVPTDRQPLETWEITESEETPDYRLGRIHPPLITRPVRDVDATFVVEKLHLYGMAPDGSWEVLATPALAGRQDPVLVGGDGLPAARGAGVVSWT